ncbi:glycosyltransferase family 4 protein [Pararobbsia silviterrae]|uniref:Glycosyltransferase family 1 protein n=1 Tax=Pararobbsia silviterrae TaxID=1792498 RepID=A0A494Y8U3_9BURK|nr:glycosyltransferase family 4 protein [Pararobbsia silviterrae]RKP59089.1 glycosyltransferase family 1 protein [Pararobbsia silviterrae]
MKTESPLHVCLVSNTAWSIYNYRHGTLNALRERGIIVTVIAPKDRTFALLEQIGVRCIDLRVASKGTNPIEDLALLGTLRRHYRTLRPDLVFHYTIKPNIYGSIAAALARVKSIAVTTGLGYVFIQDSTAARVARALYRFAFRFPREVWFLNRDDLDAFRGEALLAHPDRARLLNGEGIDLAMYAPDPTDTARASKHTVDFILIGRLLWDKGVGEYVEAAKTLRARYPHARFKLLGPVGVANPSAISQAEIDAWVGAGHVEYLGEAHDVRPYIAQADCVVLPSYREGVPRTLLEASAMAKPIVATDVPGCREVVDDGVTGLLCEARDAGDLTAKLAAMIEMDARARRSLGERGRAKMEAEFDERHVVDRYLKTLSALTGQRVDSQGANGNSNGNSE